MLKPNVFYAGYNTLTNEVFTDSLYRHRIDTVDHMVLNFGEHWETTHPYLSIKLCEIVIHDTESENNG